MPSPLSPVHRVGLAAAALLALAALGWWARREPAAGAPGASQASSASAVPGPRATRGSVVRSSRPLMGSVFEVDIWAPDGREPDAAEAAMAALDLVAALEEKVSEWRPSSEISAVNRGAGGEPVRVGPEARDLVAAMLEWARKTRGAFDPTGGPLFRRWEKARAEKALPSAEEVHAMRELAGWEKVSLEGGAVRLERPGMSLGTGAIAKGWAADRAAALLRDRGFPDSVIDAGGDLVVSGTKGGERWSVAVRDPRKEGFLAVLPSSDGGIATSGDYERCFFVDGIRYSHVLDLRTGWPAKGLSSVTVLAPTGAAADALATAVSALGAEEGLRILATVPGARAMLVREDGSTLVSYGLRLDGDRLEATP
ncbi:MAG: FAD:protein FMN transferase [Planctomycetes bacterium]|nr:FAD:protein FMN transferase [Planctomycetota bacterium]